MTFFSCVGISFEDQSAVAGDSRELFVAAVGWQGSVCTRSTNGARSARDDGQDGSDSRPPRTKLHRSIDDDT